MLYMYRYVARPHPIKARTRCTPVLFIDDWQGYASCGRSYQRHQPEAGSLALERFWLWCR